MNQPLESPFPVLELMGNPLGPAEFSDVEHSLFRELDINLDSIEEIAHDVFDFEHGRLCHQPECVLYVAESAYRLGRFDLSRPLMESVLDSDNDVIALSARVAHFTTCIASGDADAAYDDLFEIKRKCDQGLASDKRSLLYKTSVLAAMRIEGVLFADIFDLPDPGDILEALPSSWYSYIGFLIAQRAIRKGRPERAAGMAEAFLMTDTRHNPLACVLLHLAIASADIISGRPDEAAPRFMYAWNLSANNDVIMPFVEVNFMLLGLPRHCFTENESTKFRRIESMVKTFHDGWYGLRKRCGFPTRTEALTPLETYVAALAVIGWRNREIGSYLHISENTVKHQLTSVYQKLGIASRAELRSTWSSDLSEAYAL